MPVLDTFRLDGRRAIVTGGNRGLGAAFAFALAEAGAQVVVAARNREHNQAILMAARSRSLDITAVETDLTDVGSIKNLFDTTESILGGVDIVVNNAGLCHHAPALDVTDEQWEDVMNVNLTAVWHCSIEAARHMKEQGNGSIINIGSISAIIVNRPQMQPAYNASKAAVHQLTKSLAAEWAPHHIRVNALAPGYVKTDMAQVDNPEFRRYWIEDAPMQRYAMPEEIAPTLVYLASDASAFMTGSVLVIDGGYTLW